MKKYQAKIENGKLVLDDRITFLKEVSEMKNSQVTLSITRSTEKNIRSINQNRYYWGILISTLTDTGESASYWHQYCKILVLYPKIYGQPAPLDRIIQAGKLEEIGNLLTTTSLKTDEFEKYLSEIRNFVSKNLEIYIPEPNEGQLDFNENIPHYKTVCGNSENIKPDTSLIGSTTHLNPNSHA